jgi:hypothetical protein
MICGMKMVVFFEVTQKLSWVLAYTSAAGGISSAKMIQKLSRATARPRAQREPRRLAVLPPPPHCRDSLVNKIQFSLNVFVKL